MVREQRTSHLTAVHSGKKKTPRRFQTRRSRTTPSCAACRRFFDYNSFGGDKLVGHERICAALAHDLGGRCCGALAARIADGPVAGCGTASLPLLRLRQDINVDVAACVGGEREARLLPRFRDVWRFGRGRVLQGSVPRRCVRRRLNLRNRRGRETGREGGGRGGLLLAVPCVNKKGTVRVRAFARQQQMARAQSKKKNPKALCRCAPSVWRYWCCF